MIASNKTQIDKSRLGRLLVNRGYISEQQLDVALIEQRASGQRLGEVLVSQGLLTDRDLSRTLKHQKRYRVTAAFVALVVTPLQPAVAFAATSTAANATTDAVASQQLGAFGTKSGLKPLGDDEMAGVSAQGIREDILALTDHVNNETKPDAIKTLKTLTNVFVPITNGLEWDSTVEGVVYDASKPAFEVLDTGKIKLAMPTHIDKISLENIRPDGAGQDAPSMGSLYISDINFGADFNVVITVR